MHQLLLVILWRKICQNQMEILHNQQNENDVRFVKPPMTKKLQFNVVVVPNLFVMNIL
jgi:hypothetical protein